jgi:hypothetical protein
MKVKIVYVFSNLGIGIKSFIHNTNVLYQEYPVYKVDVEFFVIY